MKKLNIQAIFDSIDGEANAFDGAGQLTTFIRLKGCNLTCSYCDTKYAQEGYPENWMTVDEIIQKIHFSKVTITGGEPLLQQEGVEELCNQLVYYGKKKHNVSIETNGTIQPDYFQVNVRYVMDYKLPSSGMVTEMKSKTFYALRRCDVIKFVISNLEDYKYAKLQIQMNPSWGANIVFSPALSQLKYECGVSKTKMGMRGAPIKSTARFEMTWPRQLAEMMIKDRVGAQFSLQLHKILWPGAIEER